MDCLEKSTQLDEIFESIAVTKEQIIDVLTQIDDIKLQQNPQIEADYAVKIGYLQNALFESELAMRRAKRKLALVQACVNAGEPVEVVSIEVQLDQEFEAWQQQVEEALQRYYEMVDLRAGTVPMTRAESAELKRLYRQLCKRLHPDICAASDENTALYFVVQAAYANGDLATLRSLTEVLGSAPDDAPPVNEDEALAQLMLLEAQLAVHEKDLEQLKGEFPYAMKEKLANPRWVADQARELKRSRQEFDRAREEYEERLRAILKEGDPND